MLTRDHCSSSLEKTSRCHPACPESGCEGSAARPACRRQGSAFSLSLCPPNFLRVLCVKSLAVAIDSDKTARPTRESPLVLLRYCAHPRPSLHCLRSAAHPASWQARRRPTQARNQPRPVPPYQPGFPLFTYSASQVLRCHPDRGAPLVRADEACLPQAGTSLRLFKAGNMHDTFRGRTNQRRLVPRARLWRDRRKARQKLAQRVSVGVQQQKVQAP
jgi:hypothetical protein